MKFTKKKNCLERRVEYNGGGPREVVSTENRTPLTNNQNMEVSKEAEDEEEEGSNTSSKNGSHRGEESEEESLRASVEDLKSTKDRLTATLAGTDTKFKQHEARISYLENRSKTLMDQNKKLNERLNHLENMAKLSNIKVDGIKEHDGRI